MLLGSCYRSRRSEWKRRAAAWHFRATTQLAERRLYRHQTAQSSGGLILVLVARPGAGTILAWGPSGGRRSRSPRIGARKPTCIWRLVHGGENPTEVQRRCHQIADECQSSGKRQECGLWAGHLEGSTDWLSRASLSWEACRNKGLQPSLGRRSIWQDHDEKRATPRRAWASQRHEPAMSRNQPRHGPKGRPFCRLPHCDCPVCDRGWGAGTGCTDKRQSNQRRYG